MFPRSFDRLRLNLQLKLVLSWVCLTLNRRKNVKTRQSWARQKYETLPRASGCLVFEVHYLPYSTQSRRGAFEELLTHLTGKACGLPTRKTFCCNSQNFIQRGKKGELALLWTISKHVHLINILCHRGAYLGKRKWRIGKPIVLSLFHQFFSRNKGKNSQEQFFNNFEKKARLRANFFFAHKTSVVFLICLYSPGFMFAHSQLINAPTSGTFVVNPSARARERERDNMLVSMIVRIPVYEWCALRRLGGGEVL